jgi:hypothetical protein
MQATAPVAPVLTCAPLLNPSDDPNIEMLNRLMPSLALISILACTSYSANMEKRFTKIATLEIAAKKADQLWPAIAEQEQANWIQEAHTLRKDQISFWKEEQKRLVTSSLYSLMHSVGCGLHVAALVGNPALLGAGLLTSATAIALQRRERRKQEIFDHQKQQFSQQLTNVSGNVWTQAAQAMHKPSVPEHEKNVATQLFSTSIATQFPYIEQTAVKEAESEKGLKILLFNWRTLIVGGVTTGTILVGKQLPKAVEVLPVGAIALAAVTLPLNLYKAVQGSRVN